MLTSSIYTIEGERFVLNILNKEEFMTLGVLVILILVGVALYNLKKKSDKEVEQVEAVVVPQPVVETVVETVKKPRKPRKK